MYRLLGMLEVGVGRVRENENAVIGILFELIWLMLTLRESGGLNRAVGASLGIASEHLKS